MVTCVAFETTYAEQREYAGKVFDQKVYETVIATQHGVVHFKIVANPSTGRNFVFTDADFNPPERWNGKDIAQRREWLKRHKFFGFTQRKAAKMGSTFTQVPYPNTDNLWNDQRNLSSAVSRDTKANKAWMMLTGANLPAPSYEDIAARAEEIVAEEKAVYVHKKAVAMATVDDGWGVF